MSSQSSSQLPSPLFIDVDAPMLSVGSTSSSSSAIPKKVVKRRRPVLPKIPKKNPQNSRTLEQLLQCVREKSTSQNCYDKDLQVAKEQDMFNGLLAQITALIEQQNDDLEKKRKQELQTAVKHLVEHLQENCGYEHAKPNHECAVCLEKYGKKGYAFDCGHLICETCFPRYQYLETYGYCCHTCKKYTVLQDLKLVYF